MNHPIDDDLGARLRTVLQDLSPLATDPVPTPRFASDGDPPTGRADVWDIDEAVGTDRRTRRSRRRTAVVAGALVAAAAAVGVTVLVTGTSGHSAAPAAAPTPAPTVSLAALGDTPWRCSAPAGALLRITGVMGVRDGVRQSVYLPATGVTCAPIALADSSFVETNGRLGVRDASLGWGKDSYDCHYAETRRPSPIHDDPGAILAASAAAGVDHAVAYADFSFVSRGAVDHVDFVGPACRIVQPTR